MLAYDVNAQKRFMPASTFVPHALFALDAERSVTSSRFGGMAKRDFDGWNQDQTLRHPWRF